MLFKKSENCRVYGTEMVVTGKNATSADEQFDNSEPVLLFALTR